MNLLNLPFSLVHSKAQLPVCYQNSALIYQALFGGIFL